MESFSRLNLLSFSEIELWKYPKFTNTKHQSSRNVTNCVRNSNMLHSINYDRNLQYMTSLILCLVALQYETAMGCENPAGIQPGFEEAEVLPSGCENPSPIQPVAYHMVNRRYSEFLNLQTRLEEKTELRKLTKGKKDGGLDSFSLACRFLPLLKKIQYD